MLYKFLRTARLTNEALLSKICWKILSRQRCIWTDLIKAKYLKEGRFSEYIAKPGDSATWKGIVRCLALISPFIRWKVGNGKEISFWFDNWLGCMKLSDVITNIDVADFSLKLCDLVDDEGCWNFSEINTFIPAEWRAKIQSFSVSLRDEDDVCLWNETSSGLFSCQSAYRTLQRKYTIPPNIGARVDWVWQIPGGQKLKFFVWLAAQNKLATNQLRKRRKMTESAECDICINIEESVCHILRDCQEATKIWCKLLNNTRVQEFLSIDEGSWLRKNLLCKEEIKVFSKSVPWNLVFVASIWWIWKARNNRIFKGKVESSETTLFHIKSMVQDLLLIQKRKQKLRRDKWEKPAVGWFKLNVDGSVRANENAGSAGGVLRDDKGSWQWGFVVKLAQPTVLESELEAIRIGLTLAWEKRIQRIVIELDSREAYTLLMEESGNTHCLNRKIEECRALIHKPWDHVFKWIDRSQNTLADAVAKIPSDKAAGDICVLHTPPRSILHFTALNVA